MASPRSRHAPIQIYEDEHADDELDRGATSSEEEDNPRNEDVVDEDSSYESHDQSGSDDEGSGQQHEESEVEVDNEQIDLEDDFSPNPHNVPDPFSNSRLLSQPSNAPSADEPVKSIENGHQSHSSDGSFTTTSRIHIDDRIDPHLDYVAPPETPTPDENHVEPFSDGALVKHGFYPHDDKRKVSETVSTLPDEHDQYKSPVPGRAPLGAYQTRSQHATPRRPSPYGAHHSRSNSAMRYDSSPMFRSPESVRAMQMSSPPPFVGTPMSAKQKRSSPRHIRQSNSPFVAHSRDGTPTRRIKHRTELVPEKPKEFPLVLLHCTLHLIHMPAGYPAEALDAAGASERVKRDCALLKQKMDPTMLERGVLIQHPSDDYEVLEDRVLESLELKRPRLGDCGHYRPSEASDTDDERAKGEEHKASCPDCSSHLAHHLLSETSQQARRRWEIKVYAANGLMRSGAWSAAWREMEKVDVEVGVWLGRDDAGLGSKLEDWTRQKDEEEAEVQRRLAEEEQARPIDAVLRETTTWNLPPREREGRSPPSTATVERPATAQSSGSRHQLPFAGSHVEEPAPTEADERDPAPEPRTATSIPPYKEAPKEETPAAPQGELPLTTLLTNYLHRLYSKNQSLLLPALTVLLALYLLSSGVFSSKSADALTSVYAPAPTATVTEMATAAAETMTRTQTQTVEVSVTPSPQAAEACECDIDKLLEERGLVAVPREQVEQSSDDEEKGTEEVGGEGAKDEGLQEPAAAEDILMEAATD